MIPRLLASIFCLAWLINVDASSNREEVGVVQFKELNTVRQRLLEWALDWSRGDANAVIAYYVDDYPIDNNEKSRKKWILQRQQLIKPERKIQVDILIKNIFFTPTNQNIIVIFEQNYTSQSYSDTVIKKMTWKNITGEWYIQYENILK